MGTRRSQSSRSSPAAICIYAIWRRDLFPFNRSKARQLLATVTRLLGDFDGAKAVLHDAFARSESNGHFMVCRPAS